MSHHSAEAHFGEPSNAGSPRSASSGRPGRRDSWLRAHDRVQRWLDQPATRADAAVSSALMFVLIGWMLGGVLLSFAPLVEARFWPEVPASAWVEGFAQAWCAGDAAAVAPRLSGDLADDIDELAEDMRSNWPRCDGVRYLGGGTAGQRTFYVYAFRSGRAAVWTVFLVRDEKVVRVD